MYEHFGNPSSIHAYAKPCKQAIDLARMRVMKSLNAKKKEEILFTSCGTESDNCAIALACDGFRLMNKDLVPHVITTIVEHPAVLVYLETEKKKGSLTYSLVPVDTEGVAKIGEFEEQLKKFGNKVACVTIMHANNETGAVQPVREIADITKKYNKKIFVHTDAAQSFGKVRVDADELNVDAITIVGHKIGAPKGIAALYLRETFMNEMYTKDASGAAEDLIYRSFLKGGGQEFGKRAGTENVLHIVGLGKACEIADEEFEAFVVHTKSMRDLLFEKLRSLHGMKNRFVANGPKDDSKRLPNTLSVAIRDISAGSLLLELKDELAASAGAACHSSDATGSISSVLLAMNLDENLARGTLRLSVGRHTTEKEILRAVRSIESVVIKQSIRKEFNIPCEFAEPVPPRASKTAPATVITTIKTNESSDAVVSR